MLTTDELCMKLKIARETLYAWRKTGQGPKAYRIGRHLRFKESEVIDWLEERASIGPNGLLANIDGR